MMGIGLTCSITYPIFKHNFQQINLNLILYFIHERDHSDLMNEISYKKVFESIANSLLKTMVKQRIYVIKCTYLKLQKMIRELLR